jgi:hypothetical protein
MHGHMNVKFKNKPVSIEHTWIALRHKSQKRESIITAIISMDASQHTMKIKRVALFGKI